MSELDTDTANIVTRLVEYQEKIIELTGAAEALKAELRQRLAAGEYSIAGRPVVKITATRRFDVDKAVELLPAEVLPLCRADGYDPKKVKQYLAPAVLDLCMVEAGNPTVRVL